MSTSTEHLHVPEWDLADRLGKALREAKMSVNEMALYLGVHRNTVSAWVNGGYAGTKDLRAVQTALGHASVATTQRYTAVTHDDVRAVSEAAGEGNPGLPDAIA